MMGDPVASAGRTPNRLLLPVLSLALLSAQQATAFSPSQAVGVGGGLLPGLRPSPAIPPANLSRARRPPLALFAHPVRVLGLDLDDTLWPTGAVVAKANEAMCEALRGRAGSAASPDDVQALMREVRQERREGDGGPVSYTELRTTALYRACVAEGMGEGEAREAADVCFGAWLDARNAAAGELLFEGAAETLRTIRNSYPDLQIGAITNGRADVEAIQPLKGMFDWSVSGEDEGVFPARKPALGIYHEAMRRASGNQLLPEDQFKEEARGWVMCGDDLTNDVVPACTLGMRTVWVKRQDEGWRAAYSTMSAEEDAARRRAAESARPDCTVASIRELPAALEQLGLSPSPKLL